MNNKITPQNIILLSLIIAILILGALILRPLLSIILAACIIGYISYPAYKFLRIKIKNRTIAAIIMMIAIILLITLPTLFIANSLASEAYIMYTRTKQIIVTGSMGTGYCEAKNNILCSSIGKLSEMFGDTNIKYYMQQGLEKATSALINWATGLALSIPGMILKGIIVLFILFYFFKDHKRLTDKIKMAIPLKTRYRKEIIEQINNVTYAIVFGYIIIAVIEGIIGMIGFRLFMPNSPYILWGIVIAFLALIPLVGASIIWWPAIIIQLLNQHWLLALGLAASMALTSYIDIVTRARLIGERADIHPVYVLLGVIGGIALLGMPGIVIGPVTLAILNTLVRIFAGEQVKNKS